jgi:hypothetical protein
MRLLNLMCVAVMAASSVCAAAQTEGAEFFEKRIRPIFSEHCEKCHGAASPGNGGLRIIGQKALQKGGSRGAALIPGDPEKSLLLKAIGYKDQNLQMPPKGRLPQAAIDDIAAWVKMGAPWPGGDRAPGAKTAAFNMADRMKYWSFQPLRRPVVPVPQNTRWARNPIDRFVLASLEREGLKPSKYTDRRTLIRRVTLDLIGLPPTPAEVEAFVNDRSPDAYRTVVDRLLASPHYGERWARHWMDLVRYAETDGHEYDFEKPGAWQYRDYLIRAFNQDVNFRQFTLEHIAGDLLPNPRVDTKTGVVESLLGTTFWWFGEGKHSPVDLLVDEAERVDNQLDVMGRTFLAMNLGCARCHDHKFDPITQKDYYAISGYIKSSRYRLAAVNSMEPHMPTVRSLQTLAPKINTNAQERARDLLRARAEALPDLLAAVSRVLSGEDPAKAAAALHCDPAALKRIADAVAKDSSRRVSDPLHPFALLAKTQDPAAFSRAKSALVDEMTRAIAAGSPTATGAVDVVPLNRSDWSGWRTDGEAFGSSPVTQSVRLESAGSRPVVIGSGLSSGSIGDRLQGALRTETFKIAKPWISIRTAGRGGVVNLIIDNFQRIRFPIYGGLTLGINNPDRFEWRHMELPKWVGHRAYLEIQDFNDGYIAVDRIAWSDRPIPETPSAAILQMVQAVASRDELFKAYGQLLLHAAQDTSLFENKDIVNWALHLEMPNSKEPPENPELASLLAERVKLNAAVPNLDRVMAMCDGTGENDRVHLRGSTANLGEEAPRRYLAMCGNDQPRGPEGSGRLDLALKMTDPQRTPLLPRVIVNRLWKHHFGVGLVKTVDDFGIMGNKPSHPELLDWLAQELIRSGWSLKHMHRLMVLSATYQQTSALTEADAAKDPENRLLHRMNVRRLEAEAIRDTLLAVSGRLDPKLYGPSILPHLTEFMEGRGRPERSGPLDGEGRRSIYLGVRRNFLNPMFLAFDYPVPFNTMGRRTVSNVPAQALAMMNNPLVLQQARLWGSKIAKRNGTIDEKLTQMYLEAFSRTPTEKERATALEFLKGEDPNSESAWGDLAHVLVNLKEFIFVR